MIPGGPKVRARFQKPRHNPTEQFLDCMAQRSALANHEKQIEYNGSTYKGFDTMIRKKKTKNKIKEKKI
ncbi:hypothetical protein DERF_005047 [Dermatophagoides farinae]|uniref:Uncharacterized protein n=1 Tax=Dermatophagoides farinae TaxID=6954 RepID=A0A922I532_DERFA|nr:hypothetical protein DERF_005047 [Dermatophagoides farinae]